MRARRASTRGTLLVGCAVLAGCGGKGAPAPPRDPDAVAAEAVVSRLAGALRDEDALGACRTLTLATRRVVALVGPPGASCPTALEPFLVVHGLRRTLPEVKEPRAEVLGTRASVQAKGLREPLTASRSGRDWRVTLVGLPGVRADVRAARACGRYLDAADALPLPPFEPGALAARLRGQARLVDGFRRRLAALPPDGPPRLGLREVTGALAAIRSGLRGQARRVGEGGDVGRGMQATARADRLVRRLLAQDAAQARIACPLDVTTGPRLAQRRVLLNRACEEYSAVLDALDDDPATRSEALGNLRLVDRALQRLDRAIAAAPVESRLRALRAASRRAVAAMRAAVAAFPASAEQGSFDATSRRVEGYGAQLDAALIRLGATCLDRQQGGTPAPRAAPPRTAPRPLPPAPRRRGRLPEGTVET